MTNKKLIDSVKIGGQIFAVKQIENLQDSDGTKLDGNIKYSSSEILLESTLDSYGKIQVLWHEILHGICSHAGIKDESELLIDALAHGIIAVIIDNDWFDKVNE
jgi:hypothetical protein